MDLRFVEASQSSESGDGPAANWGKFGVGRFTSEEWGRPARIPSAQDFYPSLLRDACGWARTMVWVLDLQTGEGAMFRPGGLPSADLDKHRIWVCPMFEPFLEWLYRHVADTGQGWWEQLPEFVALADAPFAIRGYRRPGPE